MKIQQTTLLWAILAIIMGCLLVFSIVQARSLTKPHDSIKRLNLESTPELHTSPVVGLELENKKTSLQPHQTREAHQDEITRQRVWSKPEVQELIRTYSIEFGIDSQIPERIAYCESGWNYASKNRNSSASGVFQFIRSTWLGTPEGKAGLSPFDGDANVKAAIRKISQGGINAWAASRKCWNAKTN